MAEQTQKKLGIAERLYTGQLSYDFMKARKFWFTFSAVLVALTLLVLLVRPLNLGIEFTGGADFQAWLKQTLERRPR